MPKEYRKAVTCLLVLLFCLLFLSPPGAAFEPEWTVSLDGEPHIARSETTEPFSPSFLFYLAICLYSLAVVSAACILYLKVRRFEAADSDAPGDQSKRLSRKPVLIVLIPVIFLIAGAVVAAIALSDERRVTSGGDIEAETGDKNESTDPKSPGIEDIDVGMGRLVVIASPRYPEETGYFEDRPEPEELKADFVEGLSQFAFKSSSLILYEWDQDRNALYSPISLYMSLAFSAESALGTTRDEIVHALFMHDLEMIRDQTGKLFRNLYIHNEVGRLKMANSLWLTRDMKWKEDFLREAAADYYIHSHYVDFSSDEASEMVSHWISEQTDGRADIEFNPDQLLMMKFINTVYFYDEWDGFYSFDPDRTAEDTFYLADGNTVDCDFMNLSVRQSFVRGDGYSVSSLPFKNGQRMVFILPDEDMSPYDLIGDPQILVAAVTALTREDEVGTYNINFKIPKFNYNTEIDLDETLAALGIRKALDLDQANFANLIDMPLFLSGVKQLLQISLDEKGCEAVAVTITNGYGDGPSPRVDSASMILDRPFIFAITGLDQVPLFIGVINNPLQ